MPAGSSGRKTPQERIGALRKPTQQLAIRSARHLKEFYQVPFWSSALRLGEKGLPSGLPTSFALQLLGFMVRLCPGLNFSPRL